MKCLFYLHELPRFDPPLRHWLKAVLWAQGEKRGFVFCTMNCNGVEMMSVGYIYFIRSGKTNYFKIGKTYNLKDRLRQIQVGNPEIVTLFAYVKTNKVDDLERMFHYDAETIRLQGEWFEFHPLDLLDTLEYFAQEKFMMDYTRGIYQPDGKEEIVIEVDIQKLKKEYESTSV